MAASVGMARKLPLLVLLLAVIVTLLSLQCSVEAQNCGPAFHGNKCGSGNCCSKYGYCGKDNAHCAKGNCQKGYGQCEDCFPGTAMVLTRDGIKKQISDLAIGEQVAVWTEKGEVEYDDVYAHGHLDAEPLSEFVVLTLTDLANKNVTKTLELTPHHFTIVATGKNTISYKKAKDVEVGDKMLATNEEHHVSPYIVSNLKRQMLMGLYNPYTLKGTIVVNDVVTSCHSQWFLDAIFDRLNLPHLLPSTYQAILAPVRRLYKGMGKDAYKELYDKLDSQFNVVESSTKIHGYIKLLAMALSPTSYIGDGEKRMK